MKRAVKTNLKRFPSDFMDEEVTPTTVRTKIKTILDEEKSTRLTVDQTYQLLIDEREKELKETPATALW